MKSSLDRTVILSSKDLLEQPDTLPYVVMIPDTNLVLAAETVDVYKEEVVVRIGDRVIARFSTALSWICVERSAMEIMRREDQIKRQVDNARAEKELADSLMTPEEKERARVQAEQIAEHLGRIVGARGGEVAGKGNSGNEGFGMYL